MNHELAEELKDAGFPFKVDGFCPTCQTEWPTLSELIEACGDRFHALERKNAEDLVFNGEFEDGNKINYIAYSNEPNKLGIKAHIFKLGSTPEGAVARLYLVLNKKS